MQNIFHQIMVEPFSFEYHGRFVYNNTRVCVNFGNISRSPRKDVCLKVPSKVGVDGYAVDLVSSMHIHVT
jgi:hypothetical protein